jgi:hypothetical protein
LVGGVGPDAGGRGPTAPRRNHDGISWGNL